VADLFDEVDERIRSDRFRAFALKAAPWALALVVVLAVAGLGFYAWRNHQQESAAKASEQYAAALDLLEKGDAKGAFKGFGTVAEAAPDGYKSLALMQQGALRLSERKSAEAVKLFDAAAEAAPGPILEDAARLKSALALMDSAPYKDVEARLAPLAQENRPYRAEAIEARGFAKLAAGDMAGARSDFVIIALLPGVSDAARGRADVAKALIDSGSAKAIPAAVKAAATLASGQSPPAVAAIGPAPAPQQQTPGSQ
jgi:hypothetical protein